jgi:hypothetical protein
MSAVSIARALHGRKLGSGWAARCPAHDDRQPSLSIAVSHEGKTLVHCHAGCAQDQVIGALKHMGLWDNGGENQGAFRLRVVRIKLYEYAAKRKALALDIWNSTVPVLGTLAERYLAGRAITLAMPVSIRFHHALAHTPSGTITPAMVALVTDVEDKPLGIHRTFLNGNGAGKAAVDPPRMMLGACRGGGVRLGVIRPNQWVAVAEGIETTLSVMQSCGLPGLAALSADGMRNLILPPEANMVLMCADHDENGTGRAAAYAARARLRAEGRRVRMIIPAVRGSDFNDLLMQQAKCDGEYDVGRSNPQTCL